MKSNENKSIKTQIEIVKTLLDGSKKTQRQIADEIIKEESTVSKALRYLEIEEVVTIESKIIESGNRNKGLYKNNLCRLSFDQDYGQNVLKFFKNVFNLNSLKSDYYDEIITTLQLSDPFTFALAASFLSNDGRKNLPEIKEKSPLDYVVFKQTEEWLRTSRTFLKTCLTANFSKLYPDLSDIILTESFAEIAILDALEPVKPQKEVFMNDVLTFIYEHSIRTDIVSGCASVDGLNYLNYLKAKARTQSKMFKIDLKRYQLIQKSELIKKLNPDISDKINTIVNTYNAEHNQLLHSFSDGVSLSIKIKGLEDSNKKTNLLIDEIINIQKN